MIEFCLVIIAKHTVSQDESRQEIPGKPSHLFHIYIKRTFWSGYPFILYVNKDHKEPLTFHPAESFSLSKPSN